MYVSNEDIEYLNMLIKNFKEAIEKGNNEIYIGYTIENDFSIAEYWVDRKDWVELLDMLIDISSSIEAYEMSLSFKEIKEQILHDDNNGNNINNQIDNNSNNTNNNNI